jgi:hypothetical protein
MSKFAILHTVMDFLADPVAHYGAGFLAGSLALGLTWIMLRVQFWDKVSGTWQIDNMAVAYFTVGFGLVLFFALVLASHALLDGYTSWYTVPQNPPLNLDIPEHLRNPKDWSKP